MATSPPFSPPGSAVQLGLASVAEIAVQVGLGGFHPGQELVITAPIESLELVRLITGAAYRAGAGLVTSLFLDEESTLLRFRHANSDTFDLAAGWLQGGLAEAYRNGAARLAITGGNPSLLSGQDGDKVARANRAFSKASRPALELITRHEINWTIVPYVTSAWATAVFPEHSALDAVELLWRAVFASLRVNGDDIAESVSAWRVHDAHLQSRAAFLNDKRFHALRFYGPGTDLNVGLADDHVWMGGGTKAGNGLHCIPNLPTEEVFTTPHCARAEGYVTATKPLSYQGTLIDGIRVRFSEGRIIEASATANQTVLESMISTDDGAARLGEVALVPHSSPIARTGLLFSNTLFDENAASHIALGQAYSTCVRGGDHMSSAQLKELGANDSLIHVDWMIGSGEISVDGIRRDGGVEPLLSGGEWVS